MNVRALEELEGPAIFWPSIIGLRPAGVVLVEAPTTFVEVGMVVVVVVGWFAVDPVDVSTVAVDTSGVSHCIMLIFTVPCVVIVRVNTRLVVAAPAIAALPRRPVELMPIAPSARHFLGRLPPATLFFIG